MYIQFHPNIQITFFTKTCVHNNVWITTKSCSCEDSKYLIYFLYIHTFPSERSAIMVMYYLSLDFWYGMMDRWELEFITTLLLIFQEFVVIASLAPLPPSAAQPGKFTGKARCFKWEMLCGVCYNMNSMSCFLEHSFLLMLLLLIAFHWVLWLCGNMLMWANILV